MVVTRPLPGSATGSIEKAVVITTISKASAKEHLIVDLGTNSIEDAIPHQSFTMRP